MSVARPSGAKAVSELSEAVSELFLGFGLNVDHSKAAPASCSQTSAGPQLEPPRLGTVVTGVFTPPNAMFKLNDDCAARCAVT